MNRAILYLEFILGLITDMERKGISILCKFNNHQLEKEWIVGASIPLPVACEATALPFELTTLDDCSPNMPYKPTILGNQSFYHF